MRASNLAVKILIAVSLCWVLFAQDQTAVFESDPTSDLPEMMTSIVAIELKPEDQHQPVPPGVLTPVMPSQITSRSIANDDNPGAYTTPPVWRLSNPPTAPPAV